MYADANNMGKAITRFDRYADTADQASEAADAAAQAVQHARSSSDRAASYAALERMEGRLAAGEQAQSKAILPP